MFKDKEISINIWKMKSSNWFFKNRSRCNLTVSYMGGCQWATERFVSSESLRSQRPWKHKALWKVEERTETKSPSFTGCEVGFPYLLFLSPLIQIKCFFSWETVKEAPASRSLETSVKEAETQIAENKIKKNNMNSWKLKIW